MRRILSVTGNMLLLAAVAALAVVLVKYGGLRGEEPTPQVGVFQSPLGPTLPPAPLPPTPTPVPTVTPTPYVLPTVPGPFPPGPKVVYSENTHDGTVTFWVASAIAPAHRRPLVKVADPSDFGIGGILSHDGTMIAYDAMPAGAGHNRHLAELWVVNVDGSDHRMLANYVDLGGVNYPLWSPDDRYIAFRRQTAKDAPFTQMIVTVDIQTGGETMLVSADETAWLWPLDWSLDGRYLYYDWAASGRHELRSIDTLQDNAIASVIILPEFGSCLHLSPTGKELLCTVLEYRDPPSYAVVIIPIGPGPQRRIVGGASGETGYYEPIWNPNGQGITVNIPPQAEQHAELHIIDFKTREEQRIPSAEEEYIPRSWSPDGEWLAAQKASSPRGDLYLINRNGSPINRLPAAGAIIIIGWITGDLPAEIK